jgi:hypothetical protein
MLACHLAEAAEANDERVRPQVFRDLDAVERLLFLRHDPVEQEDE